MQRKRKRPQRRKPMLPPEQWTPLEDDDKRYQEWVRETVI